MEIGGAEAKATQANATNLTTCPSSSELVAVAAVVPSSFSLVSRGRCRVAVKNKEH